MGFEKLKVYQAAVRLAELVDALIASLPKGFGSDAAHLRDAVGSVQFNIAEAVGSESPGTKINHISISRGSAGEVRAVLRRLLARCAFTPRQTREPIALTVVIAKMLTSWMDTLK